jgi:hypothetical protein
MERCGNLLSWCVDHWKSITAIAGSTFTAGTALLAWRNKCKEARRAKADIEVDSRVIEALQNRDLWGRPRPFTGAGDRGVRSGEIAEALSLDTDIVIESLERLEVQGRVRCGDGTLGDPAPYWFILHR